jgi:hypothetical protein
MGQDVEITQQEQSQAFNDTYGPFLTYERAKDGRMYSHGIEFGQFEIIFTLTTFS